MSETIEGAASEAAGRTIRVPANIMGLLRQSYDTREKVLDWMLAIGVTAALAYAYGDEIRGWLAAPEPDAPAPNADVGGAFDASIRKPEIYTYNMPVSRRARYGPGPSAVSPPADPGQPPAFPD